MIIQICILTALMIAAITDYKEKIIPLWIFPTLFVICLGYDIYNHQLSLYSFMGMGIMFCAAFAGCLMGQFGGGDLIMLSVMGYIVGAYKLYIFAILLLIVGIIYFCIQKFRKQTYPIAPVVLVSYIVYLIGGYYVHY